MKKIGTKEGKNQHFWANPQGGTCHTPDPGPTRLANPNRFQGAKPYAGTPFFFFFKAKLISLVYK